MENVPHRYFSERSDIEKTLIEAKKSDLIAFDLEADGLFNYEEKVCLVQLATRDESYVLDPLTARDAFAPLGEILANPAQLKILHGGDYDVRLLKKDFGFPIVNLFDTMVAAQFIGRKGMGLAALLLEEFEVVADKKYQKANWSARPIIPEMLDYAALDVAHLIELMNILKKELESLGRLEWAKEEFKLMEALEAPPRTGPSCFKVKGAGKLPPQTMAILQALLELREEIACEWDRPPFKVLGNHVLLEWAKEPPTSRKDLIETRGASKGVLAKLANSILAKIKTAKSLPSEEWPRKESTGERSLPMTDEEKKRLQNLKAARLKKAEELGIEGGLIINTAALERLARAGRQKGEELINTSLKNWQREVLGAILLEEL